MSRNEASRTRAAVRKSTTPHSVIPEAYKLIKETLERDHSGSYVMINTDTSEYVVGPTTSEAHAAFIEKFGEGAPGWCTRIGAAVFATA